MIQAIIIF